ncbi:hypothetical protein ACS0TY_005739 [Phlomoides rotata]
MFDGDQLHQFIASSRANSLANIPLSYGNPSFSAAAAFDPNYPPSLSLHHLEPPPAAPKNHHLEKLYPLISANSGVESVGRSMDLWSNDELLALLKLRSSMEIWFPDFTWEHVSRRLAELGYKRSPDECKEKFEDESRRFNSVNQSKIFSELDELYTGQEEGRFSGRNTEKVIEVDQEKEHGDEEVALKKEVKLCSSRKKRKRRDKFEMFKGFCEAVVKKMIDQQEELHNKMIDELVKRDKEKMEREEAWKNEEMIRVNKEMEMRSKEQASAAERQGTIIEFLKKFTCDYGYNNDQDYQTLKKKDELIISNPSQPENPSPGPQTANNNALVVIVPPSCNHDDATPSSRWPRDEVLALINLRCKMSGNNEDNGLKGPLWERISQGMMELGYKRNAKRCKEKWENINKYFRKTKDSNKKRSVNSRTCPYFHHLTSLYTQGTLLPALNIVAPNNNISINVQDEFQSAA